MKPKIESRAQADIRRILRGIAQHNPAAAGRLRLKLSKALRLVGAFPERGRMLDSALGPWFRQILVESYRVFYVLGPGRQVRIVSVEHGAAVTVAPERAAPAR